MPQIITNQASLNYQYNGQTATVVSNVASAVLSDPLSISKIAVQDSYRAADVLTYVISFNNSSGTTQTNVTITDDLGTYDFGTFTVTPLTYLGPALLFIGGVYNGNLTPTVTQNSVTFTIPALAVGAQAQIVYRATVNEFASLIPDAIITNTVSATADGITTPTTASETVNAESYADVTVNKSMSTTGNEITYRFVLENFGNTEATNIQLRDTFNPAPDAITVQINGSPISPDAYTYVGGVLTLPADGATPITLPPATITQDIATGIVSVVPSTLTVTVVGSL